MKTSLSLFFAFLVLFTGNLCKAQTFSNNVVATHNTWDAAGTTWPGTPLVRSINVTGLPATLSSTGTVLKQINLRLGNGTSTGLNLSTYKMRLYHPNGTTFIDICTSGGQDCGGSSIRDVNIKYRDHSTLRAIGELPSGTPSAAWPYHIGYYRVASANSFATFNGLDPNGNWQLRILEGTITEIQFNGVDLVFGSPFTVNDITSSNANDNCSGAQCLDANNSIVIGTNNAYSNPGPATDPGLTVGACSWNGAKNNTAWFSFVASGPTATFTLSGLSGMQQTIGLSNTGTCAAPVYSVPAGGCPNDAVNNNYGGGASHGSSGMSYNHNLNFSGLTTGNTYYIVIDGTGGAVSPFYIELLGSASNCPIVLPVEWLSFRVTERGEKTTLLWSTASETNTSHYEIEQSEDAQIFERIGRTPAAGHSSVTNQYAYTCEKAVKPGSYFRIKQVDNDGNFSYSTIQQAKSETEQDVAVFPNPFSNELFVTGINDHTEILINDIYGNKWPLYTDAATGSIKTDQLSEGIYYLSIRDGEAGTMKMIKLVKK